ncbi:L,D-transpeptidase family protein [Desulfobotulus sp. H1]|uniref:L,D-transpeptidase family protein n=1 Tax=Desulfobotulus pelophilus TaxID=2823377 RepID=A0ABT3N5M4_9BACT|nr:L,D-transpeptidase family protein [Desulfobotulus pelophilus]MCW7752754.1 L,D-transpeptidase family protein [Desulfobotulus pelophilus]
MAYMRTFLFGCLSFLLAYPAQAVTKIPDVFLYAESRPFTAVVVEKSTQNLMVYVKNEEDMLYLRHLFPCSTGEVSGDKQVSGDRKTPEGVYFFLTEFEERYLAPIYGTGAFPIDYPNFMDQRAGKTGNAIWLHGTNKALRPQDTNGCVALENQHLDAMRGDIRLLRSPMIVVENLAYHSDYPPKNDVSRLTGLIAAWTEGLRGDSYHAYLEQYSRDFLPDVSWWQDWLSLREILEESIPEFRFEIEGLDLFQVSGRVTGIFDLVVRVGDASRNLGTRILYMEPDDKGRMRIVGDPWLAPPESPVPIGEPLLAGLQSFEEVWDAEDQIVRMVDDWLVAWSSQEIAPYAAFYASDFRSQGKNRNAWVRYKEGLNRQYSFIQVTREGPLEIRMRGQGRAVVRFVQRYESSGFETRGRKRLDLIREGGRWKIYREIWEG